MQLAASDREEQLEFILSKTNSGGSKRVPAVKAYKYYYDRPEIVRVKANQLDAVVSGHFDVIVMDIEGSEYFALRGMKRLLSNAAHLVVEFIPHHLKNISQVTAKEFLAPIEPHFDRLYIPSREMTVEKTHFLAILEEMVSLNESDDGLVFSKN